MQHLKTIKIVLFLLLGIGELHAQETVPATGGDASGAGGTSSYTVGQVFYSMHTSTTGLVAEGVQLPYEVLTITGLEEVPGIQLVCFPNPTTDVLTLQVEDFNIANLSCRLFDINGKFVESHELTSKQTAINMAKLVPAIYFLKVADNQSVIKTFKIIKN